MCVHVYKHIHCHNQLATYVGMYSNSSMYLYIVFGVLIIWGLDGIHLKIVRCVIHDAVLMLNSAFSESLHFKL